MKESTDISFVWKPKGETEINEKLERILAEMGKMAAETKALREEVAGLREANAEFVKELERKNTRITRLEEDLKEAKETERRTASRLNDMENYNRRNNIRVFGIEEKKGEDCEEVLLEMLRRKMNINLKNEDLEAVHRVGGERTGGKRAIIARFVNRKNSEKILRNRKVLKNTGIGIAEDLSQASYRLQLRAREVKGLLDCWTKGGVLYVKKEDGAIKKISTEHELEEIQTAGPSINDRRMAMRGGRK